MDATRQDKRRLGPMTVGWGLVLGLLSVTMPKGATAGPLSVVDLLVAQADPPPRSRPAPPLQRANPGPSDTEPDETRDVADPFMPSEMPRRDLRTDQDAVPLQEATIAVGERTGRVTRPVERSFAQAPLRIRIGQEYIGPDYGQPREQTRFVLVELFITHDAASESPAVTLPLHQAILTVDGVPFPLSSDPAPSVLSNSFNWFEEQNRIASFQPYFPEMPPETPGQPGENLFDPSAYELSPGETVQAVLLFEKLARAPQVPALSLSWPGLSQPIDLNALAKERMRMESATIGPRNALGTISLRGPVDTISAGVLADEVAKFDAAGTRRVVISFRTLDDVTEAERESFGSPVAAPGGTVTDAALLNWLVNAAALVGKTNSNFPFYPRMPQRLLELHIENDSRLVDNWLESVSVDRPYDPVVHESRERAVAAALSEALSRLSRDALLQTIRTEPDAAIRTAALEGIRPKLKASDEPLLLDMLAQSDSAELQLAAIRAIGTLHSESSFRRLVALASNEEETMRRQRLAAVDALLGGSPLRRQAALEALPDAVLHRAETFDTLRDYADPRSPSAAKLADIFMHVFQQVGNGADRDDGDDGSVFGPRGTVLDQRRAAALRALAALEVSNLRELIEIARRDEAVPVRQAVRDVLVQTGDSAMRRDAVDDVIAELQDEPPTPETIAFLQVIGDARAVPSLAGWVPSVDGNLAMQIIRLMRRLATQSQLAELETHYDDLDESVQRELINTLALRQVDVVLDIAEREFFRPDSRRPNLLKSLTAVLPAIPSPRTTDILLRALRTEPDDENATRIATALAQIADVRVYRQFAELLLSGTLSESRTNLLFDLRRSFEQRDPGWKFWSEAVQAEQRGNYEQSVALCGLAIKHSPELPDYYHTRGYARMKMHELDSFDEEVEAAIRDFETAIELGACESSTWLMKAIGQLTLGRVIDGMETLDLAERKPVRGDGVHIHEYNIACAYGRLREALLVADDPTASLSEQVAELSDAERKAMIADATRKAFEHLRTSAEETVRVTPEGSRSALEQSFVSQDVDLVSLHALPEWDEVLRKFPGGLEEPAAQ